MSIHIRVSPLFFTLLVRLSSSQVIDGIITLLFFLPEGQVLLEELNDALGVTEFAFFELINPFECGLEGVIGQLACFAVILHHLVVEDREVKSESKLDGVAGGQFN